MKSFICQKLAPLFVALLLFSQLTTVSLASHSTSTPDTNDNKMVQLINSERQKAGLGALNYSSKLYQAAAKHNDMMSDCANTYGLSACFSHQVTQLGESTLMVRVDQTGYNPTSVGEIIARGQTTPEAAVSAWMSSSGHKGNILTTTRVDVGCDNLNSNSRWWTCVFGKSSTTQVTTTPTPRPSATATPRSTATATPLPSATSTPSPTPTSIPTPTATPVRVSTPTPTPQPTISTTQPWWCRLVYIASYCSQ